SRTDTGRASGRARRDRGTGRDRHRAGFTAKFEIATGEFIEGAFVLEEDDLAEDLTAELQAYADLIHRAFADQLVADIYVPGTMRTTDADTALADRREDRVAIRVLEHRAAFAGALENGDRVGVGVCPGCLEWQQQQNQQGRWAKYPFHEWLLG